MVTYKEKTIKDQIDPATGLQRIPDDMVWEMTRQHRFDGRYACGKLVLQKRIEYTQAAVEGYEDHVYDQSFWNEVWRALGFKEAGRTTHIYPGKPAENKIRFMELASVLFEERELNQNERPEGDGWFRTVRGFSYDIVDWYRAIAPTSENIRQASIDLWSEYINECHQEAIDMDKKVSLDKFMGQYPPNKLSKD